MTSIVTPRETATFAVVPGVTAASSIRIAPERQPRGRGGAGSVNLSAASLAVLITVDCHLSLRGAILRLQNMTPGMAPGTTYFYGRQILRSAPGPGA